MVDGERRGGSVDEKEKEGNDGDVGMQGQCRPIYTMFAEHGLVEIPRHQVDTNTGTLVEERGALELSMAH
jgi:hypothetical protein